MLKDKTEIDVFIIKPQIKFLMQNNYDFSKDLSGKSMLQWVLDSVSNYNVKLIDLYNNDDLIKRVKPFLSDKDNILIIYADTPLITKKIIMGVIDYFFENNLQSLKFNRGYIFKSEYIKNAITVDNVEEISIDTNAFELVENYKSLIDIGKRINKRIINHHLLAGVNIQCYESVNIDVNVEIEQGATIGARNSIKGNTVIKSGTHIDEDNSIKDSVIMENSVIRNSVICDTLIKEDSIIGPFTVINNKSIIGKNSIIERSYISSSQIGEENRIKNSEVNDSVTLDKVIIESFSKVKSGCLIENDSKILEHVYLEATQVSKESTVDIRESIIKGKKV